MPALTGRDPGSLQAAGHKDFAATLTEVNAINVLCRLKPGHFEVDGHKDFPATLTEINVIEEHCRLLEDKILDFLRPMATRTFQQLSQKLM